MLNFVTTLHLEEHEKVIQQRIDGYFEQQGYRAQKDRSSLELYYERGSVWSGYLAFGPRDWHARASITLYPINEETTSIDVRLKVDTAGQLLVLDRERDYWKAEFDVLTAYLETGKSKRGDVLRDLGTRNYVQNMVLMLGLFALGMTGAVIAAIVMLNLLGTQICTC